MTLIAVVRSRSRRSDKLNPYKLWDNPFMHITILKMALRDYRTSCLIKFNVIMTKFKIRGVVAIAISIHSPRSQYIIVIYTIHNNQRAQKNIIIELNMVQGTNIYEI